jgi:calpain-7
VPQAASLTLTARVRLQAKPGTTVLPINITLFKNSHSREETPTEEITTSGQYRESVYGVRITQFRIAQGSYLLVPSTYSPGLRGDFEMSVWSDSPLAIQPWGGPDRPAVVDT